MHLDSRKRDILAAMGVEVWGLRAAVEAAEVAEPAAVTVDVAVDVTADAAADVATESTVAGESSAAPATVAGESSAATPSTTPSTVAVDSPPASDADTVESTVAASADASDTLARIAAEVAACQRCELHRTRTNTVPGCGSARADWLFVGEAPGRDEDAQGEPFVGRAGKLLDSMIAALGLARADVFIANVLKCRPPDNRDPLPGEVEQCEAYLHRQLAQLQPKVIVALGRVSAQALLKTGDALAKLRGAAHHYGPANIPLVVTYHPAYLLRSPEQKAKSWDDLWLAKGIVEKGDAGGDALELS